MTYNVCRRYTRKKGAAVQGSRPKIATTTLAALKADRDAGMTLGELAAKHGISRHSVPKALLRAEDAASSCKLSDFILPVSHV